MIDPVVFKSTLNGLASLRQAFMQNNPSDQNLAYFKQLLGLLEDQYAACMEDLGKATKSQSYLEGYVAGWNDLREGKPMAVGLGKKVDLVDLDTGVVIRVPTQPPVSHTAQMELTDRVAKLETDVMRLRRDMGERIRELATGGKR